MALYTTAATRATDTQPRFIQVSGEGAERRVAYSHQAPDPHEYALRQVVGSTVHVRRVGTLPTGYTWQVDNGSQ